MPNECGRKCSHCGCNGHNPRTCGGAAGFKLFGVQIGVPAEDAVESRIRKSKSLGNLQQACNAENSAGEASSGYLSDGLVRQSSKSHEGRRGKPWTEEEHKLFLAGLEKLGKGDWKGIAANFVQTRNSSQVASHAQKYFIRRATEKKRRRASIFDIPLSDSNRPSQQVIPGSADGPRPGAPLKNNGELKGRVIKASVAASERPPLSPMMKRRGVPDFRSMIYTSRPFPSQAVSWAPKVNFSSQSSVHRSNIHGAKFPACAETFVPQPSDASSSIQQGSSQATTNNDELNLNIRNLTL